VDADNANVGEIERRYAKRIPNVRTRAALDEDTRKARRYKSANQLLKVLKIAIAASARK